MFTMNISRSLPLALGVCALFTASAQSQPSFNDRIGKTYLQLNAGAVKQDDTDFNVNAATNVENEYEDGYIINGAVGRNFGSLAFINNVKLDVELGYSSSGVENHNINGAATAGSYGDLNVTTLTANMYHEFDTGTRLVPYYGLGIGAANVETSSFGTAATGVVLDDEQTALAYHLSAGVNYIVSQRVDIGMRYRYSGVDGVEVVATDGTTRDFDVMAHELTAGVNVNF